MELTVPTLLVTFADVFLIYFMKGAFGGGFSVVGIPLLNLKICDIGGARRTDFLMGSGLLTRHGPAGVQPISCWTKVEMK
jgi:hypothetical protein